MKEHPEQLQKSKKDWLLNILTRYVAEGYKPKDHIKYKLIQLDNESMVIVDLDIKNKGVKLPNSKPKMKVILKDNIIDLA